MKVIKNKDIFLFAASTLVIAAFIGSVVWLGNSPDKPAIKASSSPVFVQSCPGDKANDFACEKEYYKAKYQVDGLDATFADLKTQYAINPFVKSNCHQLTHVIGRAAGEKYGDVSKAYAEGNDFCWSGYYHGVMEAILEKYKGTNVTTKLNEICVPLAQQNQYSFSHYNCAHANRPRHDVNRR